MSKTKQKSSAGKNVLLFFIVFIILEELIVVGVGRVFKNKDVTPSIAGYSLFLMNDGNMGDKVPKGSLVVASNGLPSVDKVGQAVLCEKVDGIGTSVFWLQDVVSSGEGKDGVIYRVYQNEDTSKIYEVNSANVIGMATTYYTTAGDVINFLKSNFGIAVCAGVPLALLLIIEIIIAIVTHKPKEQETDDDEEEVENHDVQLDDFLFGGKNEGEQIEKHRRKMEREISEKRMDEEDDVSDSQAEYEQDTESEPIVEQDEEKEPEEITPENDSEQSEPEPQATPASAEIDRSYYEKASQLIDGGTAENAETEKMSDETVAEVDKSAKASLEDLMKLMEKEQQKLKEQLNK